MPWKEVNMMSQRTEFALRALDSGKTGYKWKERFLQRGLGGSCLSGCFSRLQGVVFGPGLIGGTAYLQAKSSR